MTDESQSNTTKPRNEEAGSEWLPFVIACLIITGVHLSYTFILAVNSNGWESKAQFGDASGWLNTLFSGFAFAGVIYAIMLQRKELKLQREELKLTRREMARAADAQSDASKSQELQNKIQVFRAVAETHYRLADIEREHLPESHDGAFVRPRDLQVHKMVMEKVNDHMRSASHYMDLIVEMVESDEPSTD